MAPPEVVAGTSAEDEGSKKVKKKIKKKENLCGFKTRFNSKRLGDLAEQLSPAKQSIIRNGPFGDLLDIKPFKVPHALIEFVVMNTNHALREFKYKNKSIKFSKDMVKRIFNVPSGDSPVKLLKKSDEHDLRSIYKDGNRAPIAHVFKLLKDCSDTDESMIKRTWALVALAIVVCPGTGNMVNLEYLASLENMDLVQNLAWDEHVLARAMEEVSVFQEKKRAQATIENPKEFQIRSCLPMLAIIYMDHLDIPPGLPNEHIIDYSVPRIRYVCQKDFDWVDRVDKNKLTLVQPFYGKHTQFRSLCNTPYAPLLIGPGVDPEAATGQGAGAEAANGRGSQNEAPEAQANVEVQPNLSSSFDDWLQQPFPSMDDLKVPTKFQSLYDKHKEIFSTEVDDALGKFGQSLKGLQSNRMAAMLRDMGDAIANTMDDAREKENDAQHEAQAAEPTVDDAREKEKDAQHEAQAAEPTVDEAREKEKAAQHEAQAAKPTVVDAHEKEKDAQHEAQAAEPTVDEAREKEKDARHEAQAATPTMDEAREKEKDAQAATTAPGDEAEGAAADIVLNKDQVIGEQEKNQEVATDVGHTHEQQRVSMEVEGDVPPQSPPLFFDAPRSATAGVWDDEPSFELFPKGSKDYELMHGMDEHTNRNKTCTPLYTNIPVFPVSDDDGSPTIPADMMVAADEHPIDVSSGPSTHDKNTRKKRMAKVPAVKTKGKKQKVEVKEDKVKALYEKYIKHGKPLRRSKPNELPTPFIKIGGFYVGYKKFLACLKPRGEMNDEIMSLCIEQLNLASYGTNNRDVKKYFFSVHGASLLKQDPSVFQPNALMAELERAVIKFKVQKYDLLWFAIVHERHWVVVCANLLHKQWNVFDSVNAKGKPSPLKKQSNNLITNFTTLAQESDAFNVPVASFTRADLDDYPKQNNRCDCGFFGLKYVENFDGKALKDFEQGDITRYRMDWAYNLCNHPLNKGSMELAFREELAE